VGGIQGDRLLRGLVAALLGSLAMALVLWAWLIQTVSQPPWLVVSGGMLIGGLVYAGLITLLRVPESRRLLQEIRSRLG
jgi:hypothetical protein